MGLQKLCEQLAERLPPRLAAKLPPIETNSVDDFTSHLGQGRRVYARPYILYIEREGSPTIIGRIGNFEHGGIISGHTARGRRIIFREPYFVVFGSDRGFNDSSDREGLKLRALVTVYDRLERIERNRRDITAVVTSDDRGEYTGILSQVTSIAIAASKNIQPFPDITDRRR